MVDSVFHWCNNGDAWEVVDRSGDNSPFLWITSSEQSEREPSPLFYMYYVYVLQRIVKKDFYIGYTENLKRRFEQHDREIACDLIYYEAYQLEKLAMQRERKLKQYGSAWHGLKKRIIG